MNLIFPINFMNDTLIATPDVDVLEQEVLRIFQAQQAKTQELKNQTAKERIAKLKALKALIMKHREGIQNAIYQDFKKPQPDTDLTEILPTLSSISHVCHSLRKWMKPKRVATPLNLLGSKGRVYHEPKGVALIIAPWNYPFQLLFDPLVYALAAGNAVILKPSELTPHTSAYMKKMIAELFPENEVAVIEGDAKVAQALLKQPFDHIFFTGSPMLGKVIMKAAAEHLSSVTLELGGKSPVIVDESANIKDAAEKIAWGKFINCGQTCIAPDYMLVHESKKDELLQALKGNISKLFGQNSTVEPEQSPDYTRVVNQRHFLRVKNLLDDAVEKGAKVEFGGKSNAEGNYIAPTLISQVDDQMNIMHEEIFGPLLPIKTYTHLQEATDYINTKPKPLALYFFGKSKQNRDFVLQHTTAGGTAINDTLVHIANPDLPFGGVNNSGIGKTHGLYGFLAFSNERSVLTQKTGWTTIKMLYPPYTSKKKKTINTFSKFV
jgi:aldehyde dehydrogenase (NAD+)